MTEKMIIDGYVRIRTIDQTIPDEVLDFMKDAAIEKLNSADSKNHREIVRVHSGTGRYSPEGREVR